MLALSDAALARLAIGATRVRARECGRLLQDIARKLDPPPRPTRQHARPASTPAHPAEPRRQRNGGRDLPADDQVRVEHAIAAGDETAQDDG